MARICLSCAMMSGREYFDPSDLISVDDMTTKCESEFHVLRNVDQTVAKVDHDREIKGD